MSIGKVRCLYKDEKVKLNKFIEMLPESWQKKYIYNKKPYVIIDTLESNKDKNENFIIEGILSTEFNKRLTKENYFNWREKAEDLLMILEEEGVSILLPFENSIFPMDILPVAMGNKIMLSKIFDFINFNLCNYNNKLKENTNIHNLESSNIILCGGEVNDLATILNSMPDEINHISFLHEDLDKVEPLQDYLFMEKGMPCEIFTSPRNPSLKDGDILILCEDLNISFEHILKKNSLFIDITQNKDVAKRLYKTRHDIMIVDGFFYNYQGKILNSWECEAFIYDEHPKLRKYILGDEFANENIIDYLMKLNLKIAYPSLFNDKIDV